ncbi:protein transport protein Sec16B-like isoform X1 [Pithys albifrons albifrons]|uniref:protein transport protein Sec16B-like isoform X1 n=2 Tax=Pithys albifrons albifrons TaxID=3385563 RepID=UPI003A5CED19
MATPPGEGFAESPPQLVLPAGEPGEPCGNLLLLRRVQPVLPAEQKELKMRMGTVPESSTVSLDDSHPSLESTAEDSAEEEAEKLHEAKSSGFRWFGCFWSKLTEETSSKAASETDLDSPHVGSTAWK